MFYDPYSRLEDEFDPDFSASELRQMRKDHTDIRYERPDGTVEMKSVSWCEAHGVMGHSKKSHRRQNGISKKTHKPKKAKPEAKPKEPSRAKKMDKELADLYAKSCSDYKQQLLHPPQPPQPLPSDWHATMDPDTGREYYYQEGTNQVSWTRPPAPPSAPPSLTDVDKEIERARYEKSK